MDDDKNAWKKPDWTKKQTLKTTPKGNAARTGQNLASEITNIRETGSSNSKSQTDWAQPPGSAKAAPPPEKENPHEIVNVRAIATFTNTRKNKDYDKAELYCGDIFFRKVGKWDKPVCVETYTGREWFLHVNGNPVQKFVIGTDPKQQFDF